MILLYIAYIRLLPRSTYDEPILISIHHPTRDSSLRKLEFDVKNQRGIRGRSYDLTGPHGNFGRLLRCYNKRIKGGQI